MTSKTLKIIYQIRQIGKKIPTYSTLDCNKIIMSDTRQLTVT